jgi:hypothetical protein
MDFLRGIRNPLPRKRLAKTKANHPCYDYQLWGFIASFATSNANHRDGFETETGRWEYSKPPVPNPGSFALCLTQSAVGQDKIH